MKTGSYTCRLGDECQALATVQIEDREASQTRGCFPHALDALKAIDGSRVVWEQTKVNEWARKALELTENRIDRRGRFFVCWSGYYLSMYDPRITMDHDLPVWPSVRRG
jgi:hypothetical protein